MAQEQANGPTGLAQCLARLPFTRLFGSFRQAVQPGQLALSLAAVVLIFLTGAFLDVLTTGSSGVAYDAVGGYEDRAPTEIDVFVQALSRGRGAAPDAVVRYRMETRAAARRQLTDLLTTGPLNLAADEAAEHFEAGTMGSWVKERYAETLRPALEGLKARYALRQAEVRSTYDAELEAEGRRQQRRQALEDLENTYRAVCQSLLDGRGDRRELTRWVEKDLVVTALAAEGEARTADREKVQTLREQIAKALQWAQARQLAEQYQRRGVFESLVGFEADRFHRAVGALVFQWNPRQAGRCVWEAVLGWWWLIRLHPWYSVVFGLAVLAVLAIFGGAVCRMAAMAFAREERLGAWRALQFSTRRFVSLVSAPLLPLGVMLFLGLVIALFSILGAIPGVGEILVGVLMGLTIIGGIVIAVVLVGLLGSGGLMFPAVAVEGAEGFDALSRSYSYLFGRPWQLAWYYLLAGIYGGICYMFIRLFVFLVLAAVHGAVGLTVNWDGPHYLAAVGKLDLMWPAPSFSNLVPAVPWVALSGTETVAAGLIWLWVVLVAGVVLAFVISFCYTVNTVAYLLLREKVDGTDYEDIFVEEDAEELVADEVAEPVSPAETPSPASDSAAAATDNGPAPGGEQPSGATDESERTEGG